VGPGRLPPGSDTPEFRRFLAAKGLPVPDDIADPEKVAAVPTFDRMVPGEGELPLREYLSAMPADVVVSLEVPSRTLEKAGLSLRERLERSVKAARALLQP
jgi:sugar phosphate isomerase/epimerase